MAKAAVQTTVRVDPALYERAKRAAERDGVALNTFFVGALQDAVAKSEFQWNVVDEKAAQKG